MARNGTYFVDSVTVTAREAEVPAADFTGGMNAAASCASGIGINMDGGAVSGDAQEFTLLDQDGAIRVPQVSQLLGGDGLTATSDWPGSGGLPGRGTEAIQVNDTDNQAADGDGVPVNVGTANLQTLSAGWVDTAV